MKHLIDRKGSNCKSRDTWRDDWRIQGQEGYLTDKHLEHRRFNRSICIEDYDQCEFCWRVFDKDKEHPLTAYYEPINHVWICEECFDDFKCFFHWTVEEIPGDDIPRSE